MTRTMATLTLVLFIGGAALADEGPRPASEAASDVEQLRATIAELQATIAELQRQNQTLRAQWGQVTIELDRLRAENRQLKAGEGADTPDTPDTPHTPDTPGSSETAEAGDAAHTPAAEAADTNTSRELDRLRQENEDLRRRSEELTALAGLTPQGERVASQEARIKSTFDPDAGRTVVRTESERLRMTGGSKADHLLSLAYSYPGEKLEPAADKAGEVPQVTMFIQAVYSGGLYGKDQPLVLTIDGESVVVPVADYETRHRRVTLPGRRHVNRDDETVSFVLDADLLRRLARAVTVTGRMGVAEFELSRDQIALFTAVKKRIEAGL